MRSVLVFAFVQLSSLVSCEQIPWEQSAIMDNNLTTDNKLSIATCRSQNDLPFVTVTQPSEDNNLSSDNVTKRGRYRIPIKNSGNKEYYATISLGTPPQPIKIGLDTGSANLWIRSIACKSANCKHHHQLYNASASSTYQKEGSTFSIEYESAENGRVAGHLSRDTFTIGDLSVPRQLFAEATEVEGALFRYSIVDGILGLGFQEHAVRGVIPPFENMVGEGLLDENVFAVYFGDARLKGDESELMIGGVDRERYTGELVRLPLWREYEWDVRFDGIAFGDDVVKLESMGAAIDTGCEVIMLPSDLADTINTKIGTTRNSYGDYIVPCEARANLPDITFTFGGYPFSLGPKAYLLDHEEGHCISAFLGQDNEIPGGRFAVIGFVFLREWYSVFDMEGQSISFGRAKRRGVERS